MWDQKCPECGAEMKRNGVLLVSNVLTNEKSQPKARYDCPECEVIVSAPLDEGEDGWAAWEAQGNKPILD